jgi:hypothetical protein
MVAAGVIVKIEKKEEPKEFTGREGDSCALGPPILGKHYSSFSSPHPGPRPDTAVFYGRIMNCTFHPGPWSQAFSVGGITSSCQHTLESPIASLVACHKVFSLINYLWQSENKTAS